MSRKGFDVNASLLARSAYGSSARTVRTAQSAEYDAISRITSALKAATSFPEKVQALYQNRSLWTLLATDVAGKDNGLPAELRARIFYLAEFTTAHTSRVLSGEAEIDALVEINTAIMAGLRQQQGTGS
jgi:flagellar biosynthesis activator protein FlaF